MRCLLFIVFAVGCSGGGTPVGPVGVNRAATLPDGDAQLDLVQGWFKGAYAEGVGAHGRSVRIDAAGVAHDSAYTNAVLKPDCSDSPVVCSPLVAGAVTLADGGGLRTDKGVLCRSIADGSCSWSRTGVNRIGDAVRAGTVLIIEQVRVTKLDADTGAVLWTFELPSEM